VSEDLGTVQSSEANKNEVTAELPVEPQDLNAIYSAELMTLAQKPPKEVKNISAEQKQEDYYKNFRTNVSGMGCRGVGADVIGAAVLDNVERAARGCHIVSASVSGRRG
jgi:chitin synthase